MQQIIISLVLISVAAFFKAVSDTLADHFSISIFSRLNPKFWDKATSSQYARFLPGTKYRFDAWHLSNTVVIIAGLMGGPFSNLPYHWALQIIPGGLWFIVVFNFFYNTGLVRKEFRRK